MRSFLLVVALVGCAGEEPAPLPVARIRPPTDSEVRRHVAGLEPLLSRKSDGLVAQPLARGGLKVDVGERFQAAMMARVGPDGRVVTECVEDTASAERFLRAELDEDTK